MNTEFQKRGITSGVRRGPGTSTPAAVQAKESGDRNSEVGEGYDEMLTKKELAAKLKVTVRTVENWTREGYLPVVKIASEARFCWPEVVKHLLAKYQVCQGDGLRPPSPVPSGHPLPSNGRGTAKEGAK